MKEDDGQRCQWKLGELLHGEGTYTHHNFG
jgi:hypothetical protein